jgi:hypothetical protein
MGAKQVTDRDLIVLRGVRPRPVPSAAVCGHDREQADTEDGGGAGGGHALPAPVASTSVWSDSAIPATHTAAATATKISEFAQSGRFPTWGPCPRCRRSTSMIVRAGPEVLAFDELAERSTLDG